jgi:rhodanese-related sulfurtransferase
MSALISCREVAELMASDRLFAVLDVRERGEYHDCQIPNATSLPRSQIEFRIKQLAPNGKIPIIVYDDADGRAPLAAKTLDQFGYSQVWILNGGLTAWRNEQRPTVSGVNVPSKAFGEKVHHERSIPDISAEELKQTNSPIVVNCAGRTRSIIGTAVLRRLGLTNVRALRNGTMGWVLAGFELERKPARTTRPAAQESSAQALSLALRVARDEHIPWISGQALTGALAKDNDAVTYLIDVRSEREYESGHIDGSINVPGGQAVQRADDFIAVRNAQIAFISNVSARAIMAAYWYRQMGFPNVSVLRGGLRAWSESGETLVSGAPQHEPVGFETAKRRARLVDAQALERMLRDSSTLVLDVGASLEFESAHVPGAKWISRGWIELKLPQKFPDRTQPIVVTCPDGKQSIFAARALAEIGYTDVAVLDGGLRSYSIAGLLIDHGLGICLAPTNDVVLSPSIRGTKEDMQRYLDWELKLQQ